MDAGDTNPRSDGVGWMRTARAASHRCKSTRVGSALKRRTRAKTETTCTDQFWIFLISLDADLKWTEGVHGLVASHRTNLHYFFTITLPTLVVFFALQEMI